MNFRRTALRLAGLLLIFGVDRHADASLLNFSFSFSSNPSAVQQQYLDVVPGTVSGLVEGLPANGTNVAAQSVIVESIPSALINGTGQPLPIDAAFWPYVTVNSFTTTNGQITGASFSGGIYGGAEWLDINNGNGNSDLNLDGVSSTLVINPNGLAGVTFAPVSVPEPAIAPRLAIFGYLCHRRPKSWVSFRNT